MSEYDTIILVDTPLGPLRIIEKWWREWVDGGIAVLDHYRARHREFSEYLERTGRL